MKYSKGKQNTVASIFDEFKNVYKIDIPLGNCEAIEDVLQTGLIEPKTEFLFSEKNEIDFETRMVLTVVRDRFVREYGFALLSTDLVDELTKQLSGRVVVEAGAGSGFLSRCLLDKGVDVTPVDVASPAENKYGFKKGFVDLVLADAATVVTGYKDKKFDAVVLSWPNYSNDFAANVLEKMVKGQRLYYCGEGEGGCTANSRFFDLIGEKTELNKVLTGEINSKGLSWVGIHDSWQVFDVL